ncbi:energy transducer TonB [Telluribacter sp. SYSU D00476]|uniref:energy transducer TonB n=1 Tax=Telluribacter sp. SYSU D00476 TaxID=2811430 RepID=UPI001FF167DB|nr:energy transducer TonB [Telluribacter sp. SYSU D00476]
MSFYLHVLFILLLQQTATGNNGLSSSTSVSQADTTVYTVVESPPEFPGGTASLKHFIKKYSKLPIAPKRGKNTVVVGLKLLVERDGRISAVEVMEVDGVEGRKQEKYEWEARRLVSEMPGWKPGSQDGKRLRTYALVPILFKRGL